MKNSILLFLAIILLSSCNSSVNTEKDKRKNWVYIEVVYSTTRDTTTDYLFGKISQSDLDKIIAKSKSEEIFEISDSRFIDTDGIAKDYSNSNLEGRFFYRIKDVVYMETLKSDPINMKFDIK